MKKIHAICAAQPGWWAKYDNGDGTCWFGPVAAWVVTEDDDDGGSPLYGVDAVEPTGVGWAGDLVGDTSNFLGCVYSPDRNPNDDRAVKASR